MINNRDEARAAILAAGVTVETITAKQMGDLWRYCEHYMILSCCYRGTLRMTPFDINSPKYLNCKSDQWPEREVISFNRDGFIGIAGWADNTNVKPVLAAIQAWVDDYKDQIVKVKVGDLVSVQGMGGVHEVETIVDGMISIKDVSAGDSGLLSVSMGKHGLVTTQVPKPDKEVIIYPEHVLCHWSLMGCKS